MKIKNDNNDIILEYFQNKALVQEVSFGGRHWTWYTSAVKDYVTGKLNDQISTLEHHTKEVANGRRSDSYWQASNLDDLRFYKNARNNLRVGVLIVGAVAIAGLAAAIYKMTKQKATDGGANPQQAKQLAKKAQISQLNKMKSMVSKLPKKKRAKALAALDKQIAKAQS